MHPKKEFRLNHAHHNMDLCHKIDQMGDYPDWVITTAFYSVLHFIDYKLFPLEMPDGNNTTIHDIMQFADYKKGKEGIKLSNHKHRENLVREFLPDISELFKSLLQFSSNARYYNYKIDERTKDFSLQILKNIKKTCSAD